MLIGNAAPAPMNPDQPTVLTFYMGLPFAGKPLAEQASAGRQLLLQRPTAMDETVIFASTIFLTRPS